MTITLAPNQYPSGTRPGSPIKEIDVFGDVGISDNQTTFPISADAKPGDRMVVWMASNNGSMSPFVFQPSGGFTWHFQAASNASQFGGLCWLNLFSHLVQEGEPDTEVALTWSGAADFYTVGVVLRYTDGGGMNRTGAGAANAAGVSPTQALTGGIAAPSVGNCMITGAMAIFLDSNNGASTMLFQDGFYGSRDPHSDFATSKLGLVMGYIDRAIGLGSLGANSAWNNPGGSGVGIGLAYAGQLVAWAPVPAPSAPTLTLTPSGSSIDAAGASGTMLKATAAWTPVNNQGDVEAWLFGREVVGVGVDSFWNADFNRWESSEYWNLGDDILTGYEFPPGSWVDDGTNWSVQLFVRESALHLKSSGSTAQVFTADPPPSVVVTAPTGNVGTSTPATGWTPTTPGGSETAWHERIFSSAQYLATGFDPTQILVADDAGFEATLGSWQALTNCAVAVGGTSPRLGTGDLRITITATGAATVGTGRAYSVTAGLPYSAEIWSFAATTARSAQVGIAWLDVNGTQIGSTAYGSLVTETVGSYVRLTVGATAPAGAVTANLRVNYTNGAATEIHRLDTGYWAATPAAVAESTIQVGSATTWTSTALTGGLLYRSYVRIQQTAGQWSPFAFSPFYGNFSAPSVPTLTASPSTVPLTGKPRVALALSGSATTALVEYSDDQVTWYTVRDQVTGTLATAVTLAGSPTIYDAEGPPGATRYYRATGFTGAAQSLPTATQSAIAPLGQFWLYRPLTGDSMLLKIDTTGGFKVKYPEDVTEYRIGGTKATTFIADTPIHGAVISFTAMFTDQGSWDTFKAMREAQETLLLQSDTAGKQWFVRMPAEPEYDLKLTGSRLAGKPRRTLPLVLTEQSRP